ncbi:MULTISPECIES: ABC transporter permease [unclassified Halorubrum]|uniref:ABC transporter permease n=1 Tax=unclassified Halorubrum TaxID=2642239 RepID=UPI000B986C69|nr:MULTISPECIES: ABC transporter permease [unclassified Halorubrum]OYR40260.1 hypothetical protein DJ81_14890 [Halorubrum sp. Hd13]OYR46356.1 hypothetical protein DJ74_15110 [Halorubrum sp. Ea8]
MVEITDKINSKVRTITNRIPISDTFLVTGGPILLLEMLLFLGPILIMFYIAVIQMENLQLVHELSLQNYVEVFSGAANIEAIKNTVFLSMLTTFTAAVVAYPFAYYIARHGGRFKNQLLILVMIPFWTNYIVRVYGWQIILGSEGIINSLLIWLNVINEPIGWLLNTNFSIWLGLTYLWLPFMILPLYASLEKIDETLIEAAYDLGATRRAVFKRVILPLSIPGLVGGTIFVFIFSMGAYIVPAMIGGGQLFVGTRIAHEFGIGGDWAQGAALGSVLMIVVAGTLWSLMGYTNMEEMF